MTAVVTQGGEFKVISATEDSEADTPASTKGLVRNCVVIAVLATGMAT